jgi:uncharacterized protein (TIGR00156 family)
MFLKKMMMKMILPVFALAAVCVSFAAMAQYTGPNGTAVTVKQLVDSGRDHDSVTLSGNIIKRVEGDLYQFSDGTGTVYIKIDRKRWPNDLKIDEKSKVVISGKYIKQIVGPTKVEVVSIRKLD